MIKISLINILHYITDCLAGVPAEMFDVDSLPGVGHLSVGDLSICVASVIYDCISVQ
jgi:hypothetical protein